MSNQLDTSTDFEHDESLPAGFRDRLKRALAENKELKTSTEQVPTLQKQLAMAKAGLTDLTPAQEKALLLSHDGESTPEAFRKTAEELKFVEVAPDPGDADAAKHRAIADAQLGSQKPNADDDYDAAIAKANSREEVIAVSQKFGKPVVEMG